MSVSQQQTKKKVGMTTWIMIGVVLGALYGLLVPANPLITNILKTVGQIFLRLIQMSIILLVMGQIIQAVGGLKMNQLGKIGYKTMLIFFGSSFLAAVWAVIFGYVMKPGTGVDMSAIQATTTVEATKVTIWDTLVNFIPSNAIKAMADGNTMQALIFALSVGISLSFLNSKEGG